MSITSPAPREARRDAVSRQSRPDRGRRKGLVAAQLPTHEALLSDGVLEGGPVEGFTVEQLHVETAISLMGGYWPPEAAVMRLLEELSEFRIAQTDDIGDVAEELADIKIISTCLANQFRVGLRDPRWASSGGGHGDRAPDLGELVRHSGRIARVINCYAGPKKPKPAEQLEHLGLPILDLHCDLHRLAESLGIDLDREVATKLRHTLVRDNNRFAKSFDPAGAEVLDLFSDTIASTACTFARAAKLWGGPTWRPGRNVAYNCEVTVPYLTRFARAAAAEGLDGFVISPTTAKTGVKSLAEVGRLLRETLRTLAALDPDRAPAGGARQPDIIAEPGWQFAFASQRMFVTVFSDVYPTHHVRYSSNGTFFVLQPEESFSFHGIGSAFKDSDRIKESVRASFARSGQSYPRDLIGTRIEAYLYLLPLDGDDPVRWWELEHDPGQAALF